MDSGMVPRARSEREEGDWRPARRPPPALAQCTFDRSGFVVVENALGRPEVDRLRSAVRSRLPAVCPAVERRFGEAGAMFEWDPGFVDLIDHRLSLALLRSLAGARVRLDHAYGLVAGREPAGPPVDDSASVLMRAEALHSGLLAFAWALDDTLFTCIPGSHRSPSRLVAGAERLLVEIPQPSGSLLVFSEALVHRRQACPGSGAGLVVMLKYSPVAERPGEDPLVVEACR